MRTPPLKPHDARALGGCLGLVVVRQPDTVEHASRPVVPVALGRDDRARGSDTPDSPVSEQCELGHLPGTWRVAGGHETN